MVRYIRKDELYHYGVKGMKWRKRRPRPESNDITGPQPISNFVSDEVVTGGVGARNDEAYERLRKALEQKFKDVPKKRREKLIEEMVASEKKKREEKLSRYMRKRKLHRKALEYYNAATHSAIPYRAVIIDNKNSLKHYGRSKADGAPGVGTGNWRRGGSSGRYAAGVKITQADSAVARQMLSDQAVNKIQDRNRLKDIATTGLKALAKIRGNKDVYDDGEDINNPDEGNREWFLYEDQTVALPEIVDFARRGYSEKDIMGVIKEAEKLQKKDSDAFHKNELAMILVYGGGSDLEKFVKAAVETVEEEQKPRSQ